MIAKGADVNAKDGDGRTPLHEAAIFDQRGVAILLIAKGADVNAKDKDGRTPLHEAATNGHEDVVELLISKGADVEAKDKDGLTSQHEAPATGNNKDGLSSWLHLIWFFLFLIAIGLITGGISAAIRSKAKTRRNQKLKRFSVEVHEEAPGSTASQAPPSGQAPPPPARPGTADTQNGVIAGTVEAPRQFKSRGLFYPEQVAPVQPMPQPEAVSGVKVTATKGKDGAIVYNIEVPPAPQEPFVPSAFPLAKANQTIYERYPNLRSFPAFQGLTEDQVFHIIKQLDDRIAVR